MKEKLSYDTLINAKRMVFASALQAGDQCHVNHDNCPAGTDTRTRLYVKVTDNDKLILCHCFNCGRSGSIRKGPSLMPALTRPVSTADAERRASQLKAYDESLWLYNNAYPMDNYPSAAGPDGMKLKPYILFRDAGAIEQISEAKWFGMRWNVEDLFSKGGIWSFTPVFYLPRLDGDFLSGFEVYRPNPTEHGPKKWHRVIHPDYMDQPKEMLFTPDEPSDTVIVCEDPFSAMMVALAGFNGIAKLNSSDINHEFAIKLVQLYERQLIWYDNDSDLIRTAACLSKDRINLYGGNAKVELTLKDPKNYMPAQIALTVKTLFAE